MANISIEPAKARKVCGDESDLKIMLVAFSDEVSCIKSELRYKIAGQEQISKRMEEVSEQLLKEAAATRSLGESLSQIVDKYEQTENANRQRHTTKKEGWWHAFNVGQLGQDVVHELLGPFGFLTNIVDILQGNKEKGAIKMLLEPVGTFADILKYSDCGSAAKFVKSMWGVVNQKELGKELGSCSKFADKLGTGVTWAVAVAESYADNYREFNGEKSVRFWEETAVEAILTGGLAVGAAAICTTVGAPVILGGLAVAGLNFVANGVVGLATGGSYTSWVELASDGFCNVLDGVREGIGSAVKEIGAGAVEAVDGIKNIFSGWGKTCLSGA